MRKIGSASARRTAFFVNVRSWKYEVGTVFVILKNEYRVKWVLEINENTNKSILMENLFEKVNRAIRNFLIRVLIYSLEKYNKY